MTKKFYELSDSQRIDELINLTYLDQVDKELLLNKTIEVNELSENTIGTMSLPFSVVYPIIVNGKEYAVPMSTEEPSVVAAASNGSQRINKSGGFTATMDEKVITGQIVWSTADMNEVADKIAESSSKLEQLVNEARPSLIKRGGGLVDYEINKYDQFVELLLNIDTVDAMGANIVNSICEDVAKYLDKELDLKHLIAILSNDGARQLVKVQAKVDFSNLALKDITGDIIAQKIVDLSNFTSQSRKRAVTNDKGILNGIFAVLTATGNDTRAVSTAVGAFNKKTLSNWKIINNELVGELTIPMPVGIVGGAISSMSSAQIAMKLLRVKTAKELSMVISSVGLANNLSAMRALVTTGIQQGHMSLQSKSLAIAAGAIDDEVEILAQELNKQKKYDLTTAQELLNNLRGKN